MSSNSNNNVYNGTSEGFSDVVDGYITYGKEIITARAIPDVRDGLKPVTRRILYACKQTDKGYLQKCATLVGDILKVHPHGDQAAYSALVLLTDENGSCNVPFFKGLGNLAKVFSSDKPAHMRYTKAMLNENAKDFFKDADVMELIPAEEGDGFEPAVLPVNYPVVLVNGAEGIAVSTGTMMAPFNFGDVIDLTIKYIENGSLGINDIIVPDFPTGGILVKNDSELAKIMLTGKGKLKIRARVEIEGNEILVKEVPYGKTVENIIRNINTLKENKGTVGDYISSVRDSTGLRSSALLRITCKNKKCVEHVLLELYRLNILQNTFSSSMLVVEGSEPKILGVHGIIETWCNWRVGVVKKKFSSLIEKFKSEEETLSYFIRLVDNEEWKDTYIRKITKESKAVASAYLVELFKDIPQDVCTWISERSISAFNRGDTYRKRYNSILESKNVYTNYLSNPKEYIKKELEELKSAKYALCKRKTEATYQDYRFSKISDSTDIEDTSPCVYTLYENGFLTKTRFSEDAEGVLCRVHATASSVLMGFDNYGRILRLLGKEIPFTASDSNGVYLPKYFDGDFDSEYRVLYLGLLDGSKRMLVYRDGYIGFFDTSEYVSKKNTRIISRGTCLAVRDKLLHVFEENEIPSWLLLADDTDKLKIGIVKTSDIQEKSRTSRTRILGGYDNIDAKYLKGFDEWFDLVRFIEKPENYVNKYKVFRGDFYGNPEEVYDGTYLNICRDII